MNELIHITEKDGKKAVSARELYQSLGLNKTQWKRWYEKNIIENPFAKQDIDFVGFDIMSNGNITKDFALSIEFAKNLCMLARTEAGEKVRNYFIEVEKAAQSVHNALTSSLEPEEILLKALQLQIEQKKRLAAVEHEVKQIKAATMTRPNWFTIVGYATTKGMNIGLSIAGSLGKKAAKICKERGITMESIPDPRFGRVHVYPESVLSEVFSQPII